MSRWETVREKGAVGFWVWAVFVLLGELCANSEPLMRPIFKGLWMVESQKVIFFLLWRGVSGCCCSVVSLSLASLEMILCSCVYNWFHELWVLICVIVNRDWLFTVKFSLNYLKLIYWIFKLRWFLLKIT